MLMCSNFPLFHCIFYYSRDLNRHRKTLLLKWSSRNWKKNSRFAEYSASGRIILLWRSGSDRGCTLSQEAEFQGLGEMSAGPWTFSGYDILRDGSGLKVTGVGVLCKKAIFFLFCEISFVEIHLEPHRSYRSQSLKRECKKERDRKVSYQETKTWDPKTRS